MRRKFLVFPWVVVAYCLCVILWGAYVRATGSGAGCGNHWPSCNGEVIPRSPQTETIIEFTHRLTSGLSLVLIMGLFFWVRSRFPKNRPARVGSMFSLAFIFTEALLGAGLVLLNLVSHNASLGRAFTMAAHLLNTLLLLASLSFTAWASNTSGKPIKFTISRWSILFFFGLVSLMVVGASGAITALGDTLFPAKSLVSGLKEDFFNSEHFLIRLRVWHPLLSILTALYIGGLVIWYRKQIVIESIEAMTLLLLSLVAIQLAIGVVNVLLLAPIFLQMIHLLVADLIWITMVLCTIQVSSQCSSLMNGQSSNPLLGKLDCREKY